MLDTAKSMDQRRAALAWYIQRRQRKGFQVVSCSETTAELRRPACFPAFLRKEEVVYIDVDQRARIWVRKYNY